VEAGDARDEATAKKGDPAPPSDPGQAPGPLGGPMLAALSEFVAALVRADGGELYLVNASDDDVHLHLTGTCAGCPGAAMTRERLLEPAVHGVAPKAVVKVTTGWRVPDGAKRVG